MVRRFAKMPTIEIVISSEFPISDAELEAKISEVEKALSEKIDRELSAMLTGIARRSLSYSDSFVLRKCPFCGTSCRGGCVGISGP